MRLASINGGFFMSAIIYNELGGPHSGNIFAWVG